MPPALRASDGLEKSSAAVASWLWKGQPPAPRDSPETSPSSASPNIGTWPLLPMIAATYSAIASRRCR